MNRLTVLPTILAVLVLACSLPGVITTSAPSADQSPTALPPTESAPSADQSVVPPLYFFYVNHTHLSGDYWPYTDTTLQTIDSQVAENTIAAIEGIADVLDRYGVQASWEAVYGTAQGLCAYEGSDHIFRRLVESGHEVGLHVHNGADYQRAYQALHDVCGLSPTVTSGLLVAGGRESSQQSGAVAGIQTNLDLGVQAATIGLGGSPSVRTCQGQLGERGRALSTTSTLLFPWQPAWRESNLCANDSQGDFVLVDHLSMESWTGARGNQQADLLTAADFEQLRAQLDAALDFMAAERPTQIAAWGFVTHPTEFMPGDRGENPPDPAALAALEEFLAYVDTQRAAGRVVYATVGEIAERAFPEQ